jgi:hypothetical protein
LAHTPIESGQLQRNEATPVALSGEHRPLQRDDVNRHASVRIYGSLDHPIGLQVDRLRSGGFNFMGAAAVRTLVAGSLSTEVFGIMQR